MEPPKGSLRDRLSGLVEQKTSALRDSLKARVASWRGNGAAVTSACGAVSVTGTEEVPDTITLQIGSKALPGVSVELRTELWLSCLHRRDASGGMVGTQMIDSFSEHSTQELPQEVVSDIDKDLKRTFPQYALFNTPEGQQQLRTILHAYAAYDAEVGYCQGMNFLAGVLLLFLNSEAEAFAALVLLMERNLRKFYIRSMALLQVQLWQLGKLMSPKLCQHLESCGVVPMLYGASWLMTGFSADFPVSFSARIMDVMLSDRCHCALLKVAVTILKRCEHTLLQMSDLEAILKYLKVEVARWSEWELSDVLVDAFSKPWTTRQKTILSNTEDVETVAQGMERVMDLQEQLSRGTQAEEEEEEEGSTGGGAGSARGESSDAAAQNARGPIRTAPFSEPGGFAPSAPQCVPILAPPPSTSALLSFLSASNPPSNASSNPTSPPVAFGAGGRGVDRSVDTGSGSCTLSSVPEGHPATCAPPAAGQLQAYSSTPSPEPQAPLTARQIRLPAQALSKSLPCAMLDPSGCGEPDSFASAGLQLGLLYVSSSEAGESAGGEAAAREEDAARGAGCPSAAAPPSIWPSDPRFDSPRGQQQQGILRRSLEVPSPFARSVGTANAVLAAATSLVPSVASASASPRADGPRPAGASPFSSPRGGSRSSSATLPIVIQSRRSYGPAASSGGGAGGGAAVNDDELLSPRSPHPAPQRAVGACPSSDAAFHEPDGFDELASSGSYSTKLLQELRQDLSRNLASGSSSNAAAGCGPNFPGAYRGLSALDTSCLGSPNSMLSLTTAQSPGSTYPCPTPVPLWHPHASGGGAAAARQDLSISEAGARLSHGFEVEAGRLSGSSSCTSAARPYYPAPAPPPPAGSDIPGLLVRSTSNRTGAPAEGRKSSDSMPRSRGSGPLPKVRDEAGDLAGDILRAFVASGSSRKDALFDPQERLGEAMYADSPRKEEHKLFGAGDGADSAPSLSPSSTKKRQQQAQEVGAVVVSAVGLPEAHAPSATSSPLGLRTASSSRALTRQPSASLGSVGGVSIFDPLQMCGQESSAGPAASAAAAAGSSEPGQGRSSADAGARGRGLDVGGNAEAGRGDGGPSGDGGSGRGASSCQSPHTPLVTRMELPHGTSMLQLAHAAVALQAAMDAAQQQQQQQDAQGAGPAPAHDSQSTAVTSPSHAVPCFGEGAAGPRLQGEVSASSPSASESPEQLPAPWCSQGGGCMSAEEQERAAAALQTAVTAALPDLCPAALQAVLHASWASGLGGGGGGGGSRPGSPHTPLAAKMELPRGTSVLALAQAAAAVQAALEAAAHGPPGKHPPPRILLDPRAAKLPLASGLVSHAGTDRTNSFISARASLGLDTPAGVLQLEQAEPGGKL